MEEKIKYTTKYEESIFKFRVLGIFSVVIAIVCFFCFVALYNDTYYSSGDIIPSKYRVVAWYFLIGFASIIAAFILRMALGERIRFLPMFMLAIFLPTICYHLNFHAFKEDGPLYPLVEKDGLLYFIVNGDYNFDGINDEDYHLKYDERTLGSGCGGHYNDTIIKSLYAYATGVGASLEPLCDYDWEEKIIELRLSDSPEYKSLRLSVAFREASFAKNARFYIDDVELEYIKTGDYTVDLIFDSDTIHKWKDATTSKRIKIYIKYEVGE